jgi:hypothetical protein
VVSKSAIVQFDAPLRFKLFWARIGGAATNNPQITNPQRIPLLIANDLYRFYACFGRGGRYTHSVDAVNIGMSVVLSLLIGAFIGWQWWQHKRFRDAQSWPATVATIESAATERFGS